MLMLILGNRELWAEVTEDKAEGNDLAHAVYHPDHLDVYHLSVLPAHLAVDGHLGLTLYICPYLCDLDLDDRDLVDLYHADHLRNVLTAGRQVASKSWHEIYHTCEEKDFGDHFYEMNDEPLGIWNDEESACRIRERERERESKREINDQRDSNIDKMRKQQ